MVIGRILGNPTSWTLKCAVNGRCAYFFPWCGQGIRGRPLSGGTGCVLAGLIAQGEGTQDSERGWRHLAFRERKFFSSFPSTSSTRKKRAALTIHSNTQWQGMVWILPGLSLREFSLSSSGCFCLDLWRPTSLGNRSRFSFLRSSCFHECSDKIHFFDIPAALHFAFALFVFLLGSLWNGGKGFTEWPVVIWILRLFINKYWSFATFVLWEYINL